MNELRRKHIEFSGYVFCLPFIAFSIVFIIYPMIKGVFNSFFDFRFGGMKFVGISNYIEVFTRDVYVQSMKNTLLMVLIVVPCLLFFGLIIAGSIFDKTKSYTSFVRIFLYLPVIASFIR